ncbi:hypothetical protein WJX73_009265 [Symbiochloris irregularis]|uniref:Nucleolar GTP-binding protein 1 n=1 Tax=Symbiochloris irregularis TaxID=706552 RepID=A0AAW1P893_9CHLO
MPSYNFKAIKVVPSSKDFIDIVLSRTQRQTPTVVHNGWAIARIRQFYMRKVKYTQSNWHDKLTTILEDFPKVDDIHPFYADLLNVLYDRDHFKLALGQLHMARQLIDRVSQDYVRLLKYGDSLYRCKQLKRAAMGRMCTIMKKQAASLAYLEQVRQHLSRLPSIDPATRTILVTGYPNVGKSSFMNKVTRADVDVQPYAFTTKSLFVGHLDHKYLRWQVIDTPGILDRPLEERNTIEMQSITALAHLRAAVLYIVDISEQCGYTIAQQAALFHSIRPLFSNKPLLIVANKTDAIRPEALPDADKAILAEMGRAEVTEAEAQILTMSTLTEENVMAVKVAACERLLAARVEMKMQGKRINDVANRMHVAMPKLRDGASRPPQIPPSVLAARAAKSSSTAAALRKTERNLQEENGGAGVYSCDETKRYLLDNVHWRRDIIPEIMDGHNIADFVDPDIDAKLEALEQEEDRLAAAWEASGVGMQVDALSPQEALMLQRIRTRKVKIRALHQRQKAVAGNQAVLPRGADAERTLTTSRMRDSLEGMGMDGSLAVARARSRSRVGRKRERSMGPSAMDIDGGAEGEDGDVIMAPPKKRIHSSKSRSMSRGRLASMEAPTAKTGLKDSVQKNKAIKMADRQQRVRGKEARKGEGDRHIPSLRPKHLLVGHRGKGKTDRR